MEARFQCLWVEVGVEHWLVIGRHGGGQNEVVSSAQGTVLHHSRPRHCCCRRTCGLFRQHNTRITGRWWRASGQRWRQTGARNRRRRWTTRVLDTPTQRTGSIVWQHGCIRKWGWHGQSGGDGCCCCCHCWLDWVERTIITITAPKRKWFIKATEIGRFRIRIVQLIKQLLIAKVEHQIMVTPITITEWTLGNGRRR